MNEMNGKYQRKMRKLECGMMRIIVVTMFFCSVFIVLDVCIFNEMPTIPISILLFCAFFVPVFFEFSEIYWQHRYFKNKTQSEDFLIFLRRLESQANKLYTAAEACWNSLGLDESEFGQQFGKDRDSVSVCFENVISGLKKGRVIEGRKQEEIFLVLWGIGASVCFDDCAEHSFSGDTEKAYKDFENCYFCLCELCSDFWTEGVFASWMGKASRVSREYKCGISSFVEKFVESLALKMKRLL